MSLILVAITFGIILLLSQKHPTLAFWIFFGILFDPGGYVTKWIGTDLIGRINSNDVFSVFLFFLITQQLRKLPKLESDKLIIRFFTLVISFRIYYIFIYGILVPMLHGYDDIAYFFIKNRGIFEQLIMLWGFYLFFRKDSYNYYLVILYTGLICLSLYLITLISGLPLIVVNTSERYSGSQIMRISMISYGLFYLTFSWSIIVLLLSNRIKGWKFPKANLLYITGGMMIITLLLTLTRRVFIEIVFRVFFIALIISGLYRTSIVNILKKTVLPLILILIFLILLFPDSLNNSVKLYTDLYSLATKGSDTMGKTDYRIEGSGGLADAREYISNNLLLGSGYTGISFQEVREILRSGENNFVSGMDASAEVWFWGSLFRYGLLGTLMWLPILIFYIRQCRIVYRFLRSDPAYYLSKYPIESVLFINSLLFLIELFTSHIYELGVRMGTSELMNLIIVVVAKFRIKTDYESRLRSSEIEDIEGNKGRIDIPDADSSNLPVFAKH